MVNHIAGMEEDGSDLKILTDNLQERDISEGLGMNRRTILEGTSVK